MNRAIAALHGQFGRACLYSQSRSMATHAHREGHLIFYLEGQTPTFHVAGRPCTGSTRAAIAVNPFEPHDVVYRSDHEECLLLLLYIEPTWFVSAGSGVGSGGEGALRFGRVRIELTSEVCRLVDRLVGLLLHGEALPGPFDRRLLALTQACHARSWLRRPSVEPHGRHRGAVRDHRVRKSVRLLRHSVGGETSFDEIAREVGLSRPHFFKLFRENVGVTPNVCLNTFRMERAIDLLIGTERPITSIGLDLGFASQASFTRFFGANVGIPPTEYRRVAHVSRLV